MSPRKRTALLVASVGAAALVGLGGYGFAQLRTCGEASDVRRGTFTYRLCGVSGERVASLPLTAPVGEPVFAWRLADGNKPGLHSLKYESSRAVDVGAALTAHLRSSGFSPRTDGAPAGYEWWTDGKSELGFAIRPLENGHGLVEVIHNTGLD